MNQDEVFEAIRAAVDAGEYADWLSAVQTQGPGRGAAGTEPVKNAPGGRGYLRGTQNISRRAPWAWWPGFPGLQWPPWRPSWR